MKNRYCLYCGTLLPEDGVCLRCGAKYKLADDGRLTVIPRKVKQVSVRPSAKKRKDEILTANCSETETQTIPITGDISSYSEEVLREEKHTDWTNAKKKSLAENNDSNASINTKQMEYNTNSQSVISGVQDDLRFSAENQKKDGTHASGSGKIVYWIVFVLAVFLAATMTFVCLDKSKETSLNDLIPFQSKTLKEDSEKTSNLLPITKYEVMPYVINLQVEEARKLLEESGFVVDEYVFHTSFKDEYWGLVRFATLRAGEKYPRGTHVTLEVWSNQKMDSHTTLFFADEKTTSVPNLIGKEYVEIKDNLKNDYPSLKFEVEEVQSNDDSKKGMIIGQSPSSGKVVVENSKVVLRVSKGAPNIEVPDVKMMSEAEAERLLLSKGLRVKKEYVENNDPAWNGLVSGYGPSNKTYEGSEIKIFICKQAPVS